MGLKVAEIFNILKEEQNITLHCCRCLFHGAWWPVKRGTFYYENTRNVCFVFLEHCEIGINFDISSTLFRACFAILCSNIGTH